MAYHVGLLLSDLTEGAKRHNRRIGGPNTLGIEVTNPQLQKFCWLGNCDPQHNLKGRSSAVEQSLIHPLPPDGAYLVTEKEDKDSIAAMATLVLRKEYAGGLIDHRIVAWIGVTDRMGVVNARRSYPDLARYFYPSPIMGAMDAIIHQRQHPRLKLAEKVVLVSRILTHDIPSAELHDWADSRVFKTPPPFAQMAEWFGPIVYIETNGFFKEARNWAERKAIAMVIHNPNSKHWFAMWKPGITFDRERFHERIQYLEANARNITVPELIHQGLAGGGPPHMWSSANGKGRETAIVNMKETLLSLMYSCLRGCRASA